MSNYKNYTVKYFYCNYYNNEPYSKPYVDDDMECESHEDTAWGIADNHWFNEYPKPLLIEVKETETGIVKKFMATCEVKTTIKELL